MDGHTATIYVCDRTALKEAATARRPPIFPGTTYRTKWPEARGDYSQKNHQAQRAVLVPWPTVAGYFCCRNISFMNIKIQNESIQS